MTLYRGTSPEWSLAMPRRLRLRLRDLHAFRWLLPARAYKILPVADIFMRFAAAFLVFFFGMLPSLRRESRETRSTRRLPG